MVQASKKQEDTFELAKKLYEGAIKHELTDDQLGMYLAIDVDSGDYEIGNARFETTRALRKRRPNARIFGMLHGSYTTGYIGYAPPTPNSWSLVTESTSEA